MKRPVFIISGVVIILILIAIWVYMLFFGSPKNADDTFADLNLGDTTDTSYIKNTDTTDGEAVVDLSSPDRLRQLTTKPVIGFNEFVKDASSTPAILYVEAGTGHVFSIDLETGEESRLSGTTIPSSQEAEITPNGKYIMYRSGEGSGRTYLVGTISSTTNELSTSDLDESIISFSATNDNHFLYAVKTQNSTIGKSYNPEDKTSKTLFTLPFRDATIDWGSTASDSHFAYPKTTSKLESFLFKIDSTKISRLPIDGYGMSASGNNDLVIYSKQDNGEYKTFFYNISEDLVTKHVLTTIPEKCAFSTNNSELVICAQSTINNNLNIPDSWYSGETYFADSIWQTTLAGSATMLINTESESGRELDIVDIDLGVDDKNIYFLNKNDKTLWLYERVQSLSNPS